MNGKPFADGDFVQGYNRGCGAGIGSASIDVTYVTGDLRRTRVATVKIKRARCRNEEVKDGEPEGLSIANCPQHCLAMFLRIPSKLERSLV